MSTDTPASPEKKPQSHIIRISALLVLLALIIWGTWYAIKKIKPVPKVTQTANDIRTIFKLPSSTTPSFQPPSPGSGLAVNQPPQSGSAPQNANQQYSMPTNSQPRGEQVAGAQTQAPQPSTQTQTQLSGPGTWTTRQNVGTIYYFDQTGTQQGYVESYPQNNTTLEEIKLTLQDSQSVKSISNITLNNQPALLYTTYDSANGGIAVITNGKIYYLHGAWANPEIAKNFQPY